LIFRIIKHWSLWRTSWTCLINLIPNRSRWRAKFAWKSIAVPNWFDRITNYFLNSWL